MIQNSEQFIKSSLIYTFQKFVTQKFNDNEKIEVKHEQHFTIASTSVRLHRKCLVTKALEDLDNL